jgi:hypothetical protein
MKKEIEMMHDMFSLNTAPVLKTQAAGVDAIKIDGVLLCI